MTEATLADRDAKPRLGLGLYLLSVAIVLVCLANATPGIPGLDEGVKALTGLEWVTIRKYPTEWFYPIAFAAMMLCVVLKHSMWADWAGRSLLRRRFGLFMDIAMVVAAFGIALTYVIEIEAICLIDSVTGARAQLMAETLARERDIALTMGLPPPTTIEDPQCVATTGGWLVAIVGAAVLIFLGYNIKVWGFPLVAVALAIAIYTIATVLVWYVHGPDDINKYLMTKLAGEPRLLSDGRPRVHDILVNNASGLLGRFLDIMLNTIFPYLVLGSLFGASAGGQSLIKLAFRWTRSLRGGPAHAAIVSSAMFGTISGGPIVNVLSTGVLTIPMMLRRGFNAVFAGGVEAAASSGGSIMPPVMGVAAFVLAALTVVPYSDVIVAAILPALAYFFCLFLSVIFQARKQGIGAIGELTKDMHISRQDVLNLMMIFGPILLILMLLITTKESVGCGLLGGLLGAERSFVDGQCQVTSLSWIQQVWQNAAGDAGSAGWWAVLLLIVLLPLDPDVRRRPRKIVDGLSDAGILVSTLYLMFLAVSVIDFCLQFTGLPTFISLDVLSWLQTLNLGGEGAIGVQLVALFVTMLIAILLGMGMPAVPAYVNVALLMGPVLAGLGLSIFTAHMFIFYFAVASAITPPVAVAAFAAASITKAEAMATGFSAVKSGVVIFFIPFVFAIYPEILLIEQAVLNPDPTGAETYLPGYDGTVHWGALLLLLARLGLALYLLSSALAVFDQRPLAAWEGAFGAVAVEQALSRLPVQDGGEFPGKVEPVLDRRIRAEPVRRRMPVRRIAHDEHAILLHMGRVGVVDGPDIGAEKLDLEFRVAHQLSRDAGGEGGVDFGRGFVDVVPPDDQPLIPRPDHADKPHADAAHIRAGLHHPVEHARPVRDVFGEVGAEEDVHGAADAHLPLDGCVYVLRDEGIPAIGAHKVL